MKNDLQNTIPAVTKARSPFVAFSFCFGILIFLCPMIVQGKMNGSSMQKVENVPRSWTVEFNSKEIERTSKFHLNLSDETLVGQVQKKRVTGDPADPTQVFSGNLLDRHQMARGEFTLVQLKDKILGRFVIDGKLYQLKNSYLVEVNVHSFAPEENDALLPPVDPMPMSPYLGQQAGGQMPSHQAPAHRANAKQAIQSKSSGSVLDILVLYTPRAVSAAGGGVDDIRAVIELSFALANQSYQNSKIPIQLNLVHLAPTDYQEEIPQIDVARLQNPSDGYMDEVHPLREEVNADIVSLFGDLSQGCGSGYLLTHPNQESFEKWAFNVVDQHCAANNLSFAHEVGHNVGMAHNPEDANYAGAFGYSFGNRFQVDGKTFRTVMAYSPGVRIAYYSSPDVYYMGMPTGTPDRNNGLTLNFTRHLVEKFRNPYSLTLASSDPPHGAIDARRPYRWGSQYPTGWSGVTLYFNEKIKRAFDPRDFFIEEEGGDSIAPHVSRITPLDDYSVRIQFSEWIEIGAWTTLNHEESGIQIKLGYLPGDVNGDALVDSSDLNSLDEALLKGPGAPHWSVDINRDRQLDQDDFWTLWDLFSGSDPMPPFEGMQLPQ